VQASVDCRFRVERRTAVGVMDLFKGRKREGKTPGDAAGAREKPSQSDVDTVEIVALRDNDTGTSG
jgi:hypothetical protein